YDAGKTRFPYPLGARMPSADALERITFRIHAFAFPIWTFAVICGAIWAEAAWGRYWGWDPKETWSFIAWVIYAGYLHARATPSVKRTVATWNRPSASSYPTASTACPPSAVSPAPGSGTTPVRATSALSKLS